MSGPNRQYETMTRLRVGAYTVRVWRTAPAFTMGVDPEVFEVLRQVDSAWPCNPENIAQALDKLNQDRGGIAAYEILDVHGQGGIVYPDWN